MSDQHLEDLQAIRAWLVGKRREAAATAATQARAKVDPRQQAALEKVGAIQAEIATLDAAIADERQLVRGMP